MSRPIIKGIFVEVEYPNGKNQQIEDFETEVKCIEKHKYNIKKIDFDLFTVIIKIKIDKHEDIKKYYKKIDLVPYVKIRPFQAIAEKRGNDWKITNLVIS